MAAPQTGLTSCQIGGMGYPRTVHGNLRPIYMYTYVLKLLFKTPHYPTCPIQLLSTSLLGGYNVPFLVLLMTLFYMYLQ